MPTSDFVTFGRYWLRCCLRAEPSGWPLLAAWLRVGCVLQETGRGKLRSASACHGHSRAACSGRATATGYRRCSLPSRPVQSPRTSEGTGPAVPFTGLFITTNPNGQRVPGGSHVCLSSNFNGGVWYPKAESGILATGTKKENRGAYSRRSEVRRQSLARSVLLDVEQKGTW